MIRQRYFRNSRQLWGVRVIIIAYLLSSLMSSAVAQADEEEDINIKEDFSDDLPDKLSTDSPQNLSKVIEPEDASDVTLSDLQKYRDEFLRAKDSIKVDEWRVGFEGLGTIHEQMGEQHWPKVNYTKYEPKVKYSGHSIYSKMGMEPIYNFTRYLFQKTLSDPPYLPEGYVISNTRDSIILGPKTEMNDWRDLFWRYFHHLIWVAFLVLLIVIIPFLGVCYCCLCCCRRCPKGCPPCTRSRETRLRYIYGFLLFLLIVLLVFCTVIVFLTNKMIDRGMRESTHTMRRTAEDTCKYLEDIRTHIYHLFGNNYEELLNAMIYLLTHAEDHIFADLSDSSDASGLEELERIMDNMVAARSLMREVNTMEKELRYLVSQLRDGVRGIKREVTYACHISSHPRCRTFLKTSSIQFIDANRCMHIDRLPDSTLYLAGFKQIIDNKYVEISKNAILRLQKIKDTLTEQMKRVAPPVILSLRRGRDIFLYKANEIRSKIDIIVNDLYFSSLGASRSFEDFYQRYATDRSAINLIVFILLVLISVILICGLICGCCASKAAGAVILLLALIFIFCILSYIILVGLFYYIFGLVTYGGACEPSAHLRNLDSVIEFDRKMRRTHMFQETLDINTMQASIALQGCGLNRTIFDVLKDNSIYDVSELAQLQFFEADDFLMGMTHEDLANVKLLTPLEVRRLNEMRRGNLSMYRSQLYTEHICNRLTPRSLRTYANEMRSIVKDLYSGYYAGHWNVRVALYNAAMNLDVYHDEFAIPIRTLQNEIRKKLKQIDNMILYNSNNFGYSIGTLVVMAKKAEKFIKSKGKYFIYELIRNLTMSCGEQTEQYTEMLVVKCKMEVGRCEPLANAYHSSVNLICENLVDPINGFWVGVLSAALVLLPLLFIIHRLMCLYRIYTPPPAAAFVGHCPACMVRAPGGYNANSRIALPANLQDYLGSDLLPATKRKKKD